MPEAQASVVVRISPGVARLPCGRASPRACSPWLPERHCHKMLKTLIYQPLALGVQRDATQIFVNLDCEWQLRLEAQSMAERVDHEKLKRKFEI